MGGLSNLPGDVGDASSLVAHWFDFRLRCIHLPWALGRLHSCAATSAKKNPHKRVFSDTEITCQSFFFLNLCKGLFENFSMSSQNLFFWGFSELLPGCCGVTKNPRKKKTTDILSGFERHPSQRQTLQQSEVLWRYDTLGSKTSAPQLLESAKPTLRTVNDCANHPKEVQYQSKNQ